MELLRAENCANTSPDFERLIKNAEFENSEQVRLIQDEIQILTDIQRQNEKKTVEIAKFEELINELNTDAGNLYKQFKQNEEITSSLKRATSLLEHHEDHLQKEYEKTKAIHEEEREANKIILKKYSSRCNEYQKIYSEFPSVKKVTHLREVVTKSNTEVDDLENQIGQLRIQLREAETEKDHKKRHVQMIISHLCEVSKLKCETKKTVEDIQKQTKMLALFKRETDHAFAKLKILDARKKAYSVPRYQTDERCPYLKQNIPVSTGQSENIGGYEQDGTTSVSTEVLNEINQTSDHSRKKSILSTVENISEVVTETVSSKQTVSPVKDLKRDAQSPAQNGSNRSIGLQLITSPRIGLHRPEQDVSSNKGSLKSGLKMPQCYLSPLISSPSAISPRSPGNNSTSDENVTRSKIPRIDNNYLNALSKQSNKNIPERKLPDRKITIPNLLVPNSPKPADQGSCIRPPQFTLQSLQRTPPRTLGNVGSKENLAPALKQQRKTSLEGSDNGNDEHQDIQDMSVIRYVDMPPDDLKLSDLKRNDDVGTGKSPDRLLYGLSPKTHAKKLSELNQSPTDGFLFSSRPMFNGDVEGDGDTSKTGFFRMNDTVDSGSSFFGGERSLFSFGSNENEEKTSFPGTSEEQSPGGVFGGFGDCQDKNVNSWASFGSDQASEQGSKSSVDGFSFNFNSQTSPETPSGGFSLF